MADEKTVTSSDQSELLEFLNQNKVAIIVGAVLLLAVILFVTFYLNGKSAVPTSTQTDVNQVQVLPSTTRTIDDSKPTDASQVGSEMRTDPFSGPLALKGTIVDPSGKSVAIIEAGNLSYVVKKGEKIAGGWTVMEIHQDKVVLASKDENLELEFNGVTTASRSEEGGKTE